jgi:hypothetical protein
MIRQSRARASSRPRPSSRARVSPPANSKPGAEHMHRAPAQCRARRPLEGHLYARTHGMITVL